MVRIFASPLLLRALLFILHERSTVVAVATRLSLTDNAWSDTELSVSAEISRFKAFTGSDCHSEIGKRLGASCLGDTDRLDEAGKSAVAISLTLCSMASALQDVPKECEPWAPTSGDTSDEIQQQQRGRCLSALHRSPQDWTSYNAFLSDSAQLCHALSSQHESKVAKERYTNATRTFLDLLARQRLDVEDRARADHAIQEEIIRSQQESRQMSQLAGTALYDLQSHLERQAQLIHELQAGFDTFQDGAEHMWTSMDDLSQEKTAAMLSAFDQKLYGLLGAWNEELVSKLDLIMHQHDHDIARQHSQVDLAVRDTVASARDQIIKVHMVTEERMAAMALEFDGMDQSLLRATKGLAQLDRTAMGLAPVLQGSLDYANQLKDAHRSLDRSLDSTSKGAQSLLQDITTSLDFFNSTLANIKSSQLPVRWTAFGSLSVFGGPSLLPADWTQLPHAKLAMSILWWISDCLVRATFLGVGCMISLLASVWVLAMTGPRSMLRRVSRILDQQKDDTQTTSHEEEKIQCQGRQPIVGRVKVRRQEGRVPPAGVDVKPRWLRKQKLDHTDVIARHRRAVTAPL